MAAVLDWESVGGTPFLGSSVYRAEVPGGWLVVVESSNSVGDDSVDVSSITFVPDPKRTWDGRKTPRATVKRK